MKFRIARHTNNLTPLIAFYKNILGFEILGQFTGHDGYDGVFIGLPQADWHLEFTVSADAPNHEPDEDDLLVFYADSLEQYEDLLQKFAAHSLTPLKPKNPYWEVNGTTFSDPDGYRLVIAMPPMK